MASFHPRASWPGMSLRRIWEFPTYATPRVRKWAESPVAGLLNAALAISAGLAEVVLVPIGWNGYSALRPRPGARPNKRRFSAAFFETVKNYYAPYGLRSAPWWYSLYLQRYVKHYNVPPEAPGAVAVACRK